MIDFGVLPPEINSGRMYAGVGAGPLIEAAAAWQAIASTLMAAGAGMGATTGELMVSWLGPSSVMMGMSSTQFVEWVMQTAIQAEATAAAAMGAADAYATAFTATVPPVEVEANQTALAAAIGGLPWTAPAVAQLEAQYQEMWAQDASTMYTYAAANAAYAASLVPFEPAIPNTDPLGLASQVDAVGQAAGTDAGQVAQTVSGADSNLGGMSSAMGDLAPIAQAPVQALSQIPQTLGQLASPLGSMMSQMGSMFGGGGGGPTVAGLSGFGSFGGGGGSPVSATMGRGMGLPSAIGGMGGKPTPLSVPASWAGSVERTTTTEKGVATALTNEEGATGVAGTPRAGAMPMGGAGGNSSPGTPVVDKRKQPRQRVMSYYP